MVIVMDTFIEFIVGLAKEELFNNSISYEETVNYFINGGCLQLADIVHEFVPDMKYMEHKKIDHIGIYYKGNVYDSTGVQDINDFSFVTENRLKEIRERYGIPEYNYINGMSVVEYMKNIIMDCSGYEDLIPKEKSL